MSDKDGGPAFPVYTGNSKHWEYGMSLRDWFAGMADVSGYEFPDADLAASTLGIDPPSDDSRGELLRFSYRAQAKIRYAIADAMLAARSK